MHVVIVFAKLHLYLVKVYHQTKQQEAYKLLINNQHFPYVPVFVSSGVFVLLAGHPATTEAAEENH